MIPIQGAWVPYLVRELTPHAMWCNQKNKFKNKVVLYLKEIIQY